MADLEDLIKVVRSCPVIDNHAHNVLLPSKQHAHDLLSATTEAQGDALSDTHTSLPHIRATRQLRQLYDLDENATWEDVIIERDQVLQGDYESFLKRCFAGIHTVLMDDGVDNKNVYLCDWHDDFIVDRTLRIVRIETIATDILREMHRKNNLPIGPALHNDEMCAQAWIAFLQAFEAAIVVEINDADVAGFKSVICSRTGLDVRIAGDVQVATSGLEAFQTSYLPNCTRNDFRIDSKGLNDSLVISTCRLLSAAFKQDSISKPLQFQTGIGDCDTHLFLSDPSHLQPLISEFPDVRFIFLQTSYPYTRQAGHLAKIYKNVFLDIGQVFPQVSRDGQELILRQCMEVTPLSKLLFSSNAHLYGEIYWLALKQFRQALENILVDYVQNDDLTAEQAITFAKDIFFNNAKRVYNLLVDFPDMESNEPLQPCTRAQRNRAAKITQAPQPLQLGWKGAPTTHQKPAYHVNALTDFTEQHPALKFVHVQWLDYVATMRTHVLPITEFRRLVTEGDRIAMSPSNTGLIHPDHADSDTSQMYAEPDLTTLRLAYSKGPLVSATTIASFRNQDASPSPCCPRTSLQNLANLLSSTHNLTFDIAFDLKVVFLKQNDSKDEKPIPWTTNHTSHGSFSPEQDQLAFPLLAEIADELDKIGIRVSNFHAETAAGQYNFVLKSLALVQAIDTLVQARQVVKQIARGYGLRVTLFSTPLASATSIQHANISLASTTLSPDELANKESCFFAAVMAHLPLLCAFSPTTTTATATANIIPPPPRKLKQQTWRLAHLTASSNLYLAFTALLSLGLGGLNEEMQDVTVGLDEEMQDLTVVNDEESTTTTTLTSSTMAQSLQQVERDELIKESMGAELIDAFVAVNKGQLHVLEGLKDDEVRFEWLSERY